LSSHPEHERQKDLPSREVVERFTNALWRIHRHLRSGVLSQDGKEVTREQWQILRYLKRVERCTIGQLADSMDVRPSTMSQMLDRLEKQEWVVRTRSPEDFRVRLIELTPVGRVFIRSIEGLRQDRLSPALETLTSAEQETLTGLLTRVAQACGCWQNDNLDTNRANED